MADIPILKRPAFFDGQRLEANDLAGAQAFHRELRWLHNRSLHNWGIAFGYAVSGKRKARSVHLEPGYAIDCEGRELILAEPIDLAIPPVAGGGDGPATFYLTVSYVADRDLAAETRDGTCDTSGAVRRPERPLLRWQDPDDGYRFGLDIVLATIEVENCELASDVSGAVRRDALLEQQPYVAAGQTPQGATIWRLWPEAGAPLGVVTTVTTTPAGFRGTPRYQAHVVGERVFNADIVIDGFAQVIQPTAAGFDLAVLLPQAPLASSLLNPEFFINDELPSRLQGADPEKEQLGWYVVWMGVEG